ncbi:hypothetical protein EV175_002787 [Coemansia sp. RSA 1933]|nr:hypothetical protein EV175_002787 [Coemansia sp. RSA 1933]
MLEIVVDIDQGCSKSLVYKNRGSSLSGQLKIRTSDRLKLRQLVIRLISTELVDISDDLKDSSSSSALSSAGGSSSLHPYLQKTSIAVCTWAVLPKNGTTHVLEPGNHQYAINMPLPKGLDGSIETKAYALRYELETRLGYSFILKPDTTTLTSIELDQVPLAPDLYSDDRISLNVPTRQYVPATNGEALRPTAIPLGQALCLKKDIMSLRAPFEFTHLWNNRICLRLRFSRGRAFSVTSKPLISFEALPTNKEYKVTKVTAYVEEITIIAQPQKAKASTSDSGRQKSNSISFNPGSSVTNPYGDEAQTLLEAVKVSQTSHTATSSQDSLDPNTLHNAMAYAHEWASGNTSAITKVRELGRDTHSSRFGPIELPKSHGMLNGNLHMQISRTSPNKAAHPDMRNWHIQIHHQLVYDVQYHRVKSVATDDDIVEGNATVKSMNTQRIKAVARMYSRLDQSNIVRRDELKPNDPALVAPLTHEYWSKPRTVRGTLPIAVVSGKIGEMWGIRDVTVDDDEVSDFGQEQDATCDMPLPAQHHIHSSSASSSSANVDHINSMVMPMPSLSRSGKGNQSMHSSSGSTQIDEPYQSVHFGSSSGYPPDIGGMYPPPMPQSAPALVPMGFNPMLFPTHLPCPPSSAYPPTTTMGIESMNPAMGAPFTSPPMPSLMPGMPSQQQQSNQYGGMAGAVPYNSSMIQQQILQFQEQQRQQQQQFFEQLSRQYSQIAQPQPDSHGSPATSVPQIVVPYPPPTSAAVEAQSPVPTGLPTTEPTAIPTVNVASEQTGPTPASVTTLNRRNTTASEDTMLASIEALEQISVSAQSTASAAVNVTSEQNELPASSITTLNRQNATASEDTMLAAIEALEQISVSAQSTASAAAASVTGSQVDNHATTVTSQDRLTSEDLTTTTQSANSSSTGPSTSASANHPETSGRSSPPPNYEDLLPPDYEVPATQPPPYNAVERNRSRR